MPAPASGVRTETDKIAQIPIAENDPNLLMTPPPNWPIYTFSREWPVAAKTYSPPVWLYKKFISCIITRPQMQVNRQGLKLGDSL
jgi:hypothetical protein